MHGVVARDSLGQPSGGALQGEAPIGRGLVDRAMAKSAGRSPWAARLLGGALLRQRRFAEAETLLATAAQAFPRHAGVRARHALATEMAGRWAEAAELWRDACALQPRNAAYWRGLARSLRLAGDIPGATTAMERAAALAPNRRSTLLETAYVFSHAGRAAEAIPIWERLLRRRPADPLFIQGYADCLTRLDRFDEAERQIAIGLARHPAHRSLVAAKGTLAVRRQEWDEAYTIWSSYRAAYPDDKIAQNYLERITSVRQLAAASQSKQPRLLVPVAVELVEDEAVRALLLRFGSIGSDCEFGLVQRRYGAEPLGLLRWSDVAASDLAAALEARFAGMGEPELTQITVGDDGELCVGDRRWSLSMNTFLFIREVSPEALLPKMCRRVAYLRDKFVEDLEAADKILIFKGEAIDLAWLSFLHARLAAYGANRLLHVRVSPLPGWDGPDAEVGTTVELAPGLHLGRLSRYGNDGPAWNIAYDEWVAMCRSVAAFEPVEA